MGFPRQREGESDPGPPQHVHGSLRRSRAASRRPQHPTPTWVPARRPPRGWGGQRFASQRAGGRCESAVARLHFVLEGPRRRWGDGEENPQTQREPHRPGRSGVCHPQDDWNGSTNRRRRGGVQKTGKAGQGTMRGELFTRSSPQLCPGKRGPPQLSGELPCRQRPRAADAGGRRACRPRLSAGFRGAEAWRSSAVTSGPALSTSPRGQAGCGHAGGGAGPLAGGTHW